MNAVSIARACCHMTSLPSLSFLPLLSIESSGRRKDEVAETSAILPPTVLFAVNLISLSGKTFRYEGVVQGGESMPRPARGLFLRQSYAVLSVKGVV